MKFTKLLEPGRIGSVHTKNRMVKNAAGMCYSDERGLVTEKHVAFYEALARGGVGLINVETCCVDYPLGVDAPDRLYIADEKCIPNFSQLPRVIHKYGCPTFLQLVHAGNWHNSFTGLQPVSSSYLSEKEVKERSAEFLVPRELTIAGIEEIVDKFASAAVIAQKAGFDGIEINAATNHLVNSFLSRVWNMRKDAYGNQTLESRSRFIVEIIREIKKRLGKDFPVSIEYNGMEFGRKEGTTIQEAQGFARIFEKAGADSLNVRAYGFGGFSSVDAIGMIFPEEYFYPEARKPMPKQYDWSHKGVGALLPLAAAVKQVVSIPVMSVGRLDPIVGEMALREGKTDFVAMVRRLIADPELPNKIIKGKLEDIAPCTACFECRRHDRFIVDKANGCRQGSVCRINAAVGGVLPYEIKKADKKKKVVVVGGGPAGMEAARVAALRGHDVTLYEKEPKLGGLLPLAALVKGLEVEDLVGLVNYLKTQMTKLGVTVKLGKKFTPSIIEEIKPDAVILATGGIADELKIPGINRRNVVSNKALHKQLKFFLKFFGVQTLRQLTNIWMPVGKRVVIIGGAIQGAELAEFLVKRGRKVTIVEKSKSIGDGLERKQPFLVEWLAEKGVTMLTEVRSYDEITDKGLVITTKDSKKITIEANTIVPALPFVADTELIKSLKGKVSEVYAIGDCYDPRRIVHAVNMGYNTSLKI